MPSSSHCCWRSWIALNDQVVQANACEDAREDVASVLETHPEDSLTQVELRFDVSRPNGAIMEAILAALAVFVTPQPLENRDQAFQKARRLMLSQLCPSETDRHAACTNLKISVGLAHSRAAPPLQLMRVVEKAQAAVSRARSFTYAFATAPFELYVQPSTLTMETITQMNAWRSRGARLPFNRAVIMPKQWPSRRCLGLALSAIFQPQLQSDPAGSPGGFVKVTVVDAADRDSFIQI